MDLFTTGQVLKLTGMAENTFDRWVREGIIEPVKPSEGTGNYRQFGRMQAVGIAFAWARRREGGAALKWCKSVIAQIGSLSEQELLSAFASQRTHVFPGIASFCLMAPWGGADPHEFNLATVYYRVAKKMQAIEKRPVKVGRGHRRMETATR